MTTFELDLRFTAGLWLFADAEGRFDGAPISDDTLRRALDVAASVSDRGGLVGLEARYPTDVHAGNLHIWESALEGTGLRIVSVIAQPVTPAHGWTLANSDPHQRGAAIERTAEALRLARSVGADFAGVWAGLDAYRTPFALDVAGARARFEEGLASAMDLSPGVRVAVDVEPFEPSSRGLYSTPADVVLLGEAVESRLGDTDNRTLIEAGHALVTADFEVGRYMADTEDLPGALSWSLSRGRLAHVHWTSWPLSTYDPVPGIGPTDPTPLEAGVHLLKMYGYTGLVGIDLNPVGISGALAVQVAMDAFRSANDRIRDLDPAHVIESWTRPHRSLIA